MPTPALAKRIANVLLCPSKRAAEIIPEAECLAPTELEDNRHYCEEHACVGIENDKKVHGRHLHSR